MWRNQNKLKTNLTGKFGQVSNQNTSVWADEKETEREKEREEESSSKVLETQSQGVPQSSIERVRWFYHHGRNHPPLSTKPEEQSTRALQKLKQTENKRPTKPEKQSNSNKTQIPKKKSFFSQIFIGLKRQLFNADIQYE